MTDAPESPEARLLQIIAQWRAMVQAAFEEGPIAGDEIGHMARWTAVEMCADDLAALLRGRRDAQRDDQGEKEDEKEDHTRGRTRR